MEKTTYELITVITGAMEECLAYGINCKVGSTDVKRYTDISSDKQEMENLVALCNSLDVAPEHIDDIVEDFLFAHK